MKTVAQVLKAVRPEAKELQYQNMVVMERSDFDFMLEQVVRKAFEAGQAAGPAKPKKESRKKAVDPRDDWETDLQDTL